MGQGPTIETFGGAFSIFDICCYSCLGFGFCSVIFHFSCRDSSCLPLRLCQTRQGPSLPPSYPSLFLSFLLNMHWKPLWRHLGSCSRSDSLVFDPWSPYSGVKEKHASRKCVNYAASLMDTMQKNKAGEKSGVGVEETAVESTYHAESLENFFWFYFLLV